MKIDGQFISDETVNGVINLLVIKSAWRLIQAKKGENFYSTKIITEAWYKSAKKGERIKYIKKTISKMNISDDIWDGKLLFLSPATGASDFATLNSVKDRIRKYIKYKRDGIRTSRELIQGCETDIRNCVKRQLALFNAVSLKCKSPELRNVFEYFINGDVLAPDHYLRLIEGGLEGISIKTFMENINNGNVLEKHIEVVREYLIKLQAVVALKEDIMKYNIRVGRSGL